MADRLIDEKSDATEQARIDAALHHTVMDYQATGMRWATWAAAAWAGRMGAIGVEAMDFAARRLREDAKAAHEMGECRSLAEIREVQARFMQDAVEQYTQECARLAGKGAEIVNEMQDRARNGSATAHEPKTRHPQDVVGEDGAPENVAV